jgi:hypothetical protein
MHHTEQGSCHCKAVAFELDIDPAQPSLRCNCSYCLKVRSWALLVPDDAFRLTRGEASLGAYEFDARRERHHFCLQCGVRVFGRGHRPDGTAYVTVNVSCLDEVSADRLAALPVRYVDGANDRWDSAPDEVRHL